ncbi:MAG: hypothetical protein AAGE13_10595, partial [Pseudomonadota bacterium]
RNRGEPAGREPIAGRIGHGVYRTGDYSAGVYSTGDYSAGDYSAGNYSAGEFGRALARLQHRID